MRKPTVGKINASIMHLTNLEGALDVSKLVIRI